MIKLDRGAREATLNGPAQDECLNDPSSDARLVEQVRRGDRDMFGVLVARYEKKLLNVLRRMVHDPEQARDLAQDTFLKVYERLDQFDTSRRFGPWLFRVAMNLAVDWLRRKRPVLRCSRVSGEDEHPYEVAEPDPRPNIDLGQEIQHVLDQIPIKYRRVLILRDLEGFSCSEVAAIEGRREATIRWRLSLAREMFRKVWESRGNKER